MKCHLPVLALAVAVLALVSAGCSTAPGSGTAKKIVKITGQIVVSDDGKIQKTGLAPIWIYDATNVLLTTPVPVPDFGGRSRKDWQRIVKDYPNSLKPYSDCEAAQKKASDAEIKYRDANEEYWDKRQELHGQTNGPDFETVKQLEIAARDALATKNLAWDQYDDMKELIVLWNNINPGILYAGLPEPIAKIQTGKNGNFSFDLPAGKKVLLAAHVEAAIDGDPGCYFWLVPFDSGNTATNSVVLNDSNVRCKHDRTTLRQVILPQPNGAISSGLWMLNRVRDARQN